MRSLDKIRLRIRSFFRKDLVDQELDRELRFHIDRQIEENIAAGMTHEESRQAALRLFGGLSQVENQCRDQRGFRLLDELTQDLRGALRTLTLSRGFATVAMVTLAIGIGANTAVFSIVNGVLLRPLPYKNPDGLVRIVQTTIEVPPTIVRTPVLDQQYFEGIRGKSQMLAEVTAFNSHPNTGSLSVEQLTMALGDRDEPLRLAVTRVSSSLFPMLGVEPLRGRTFQTAEELEGSNKVAILSFAAWTNYFGGNDSVLGRQLKLDNSIYLVTGVMPKGFEFPNSQTEIWIPLTPSPGNKNDGDYEDPLSRNHEAIARLRDGASREQAEAEVETIVRQIDAINYPLDSRFGAFARQLRDIPRRIEVVSVKDELVAPVQSALHILFIAVGLVLMIACANVANLLLARTLARRREIAIRAALGAGRLRLLRQVVIECVVLAVAGGLVGVAFAFFAIQLVKGLGVGNIPRLENVTMDSAVLAFTLALSILTGIVFGLAPAIRLARTDPMEAIREGAAAASAGFTLFGRYRSKSVLVIAEMAAALVLLVGASLLIRSFVALVNTNPGYDAANVLTFQLRLPPDRYTDPRPFHGELTARLEALPNVRVSGLTSLRDLPLSEFGPSNVKLEGLPIPMGSLDYANVHRVSWKYFNAMGIRVLYGRGFDQNDHANQAVRILISKTMMRRFFGNENPVGMQVRFGLRSTTLGEVVGVVDDIWEMGINTNPLLDIYVNMEQFPGNSTQFNVRRSYVVVRTNGDPRAIIPDLRSIVRQLDPALTLDDVATMEDRVARSSPVARPRFYAVLLGSFASLALMLALIGVYGIMTFAVAQRIREIGIRMTLGALRHEVLWLVLRQGLTLTIAGTLLGLALATMVTSYLDRFLFGLTSLDPATFIAAALAFATVATMASLIPAYRATKVDPIIVLRQD